MPVRMVYRLAHHVAARLLLLAEIERTGVELAPRYVHLQQVLHLAQLVVVVGEHGNHLVPRARA